ncbi:hypothetical protein DPMN_049324 [Dreissena polymorpha]|uniref:Uncharacterized protein n=1 Tax=Dreissena polymorpha TaxID=45954 RepID=A0A9D4HL72_DREPO|nr:hypothetical protein DPMN_049324 [Dreissena polymorpha]
MPSMLQTHRTTLNAKDAANSSYNIKRLRCSKLEEDGERNVEALPKLRWRHPNWVAKVQVEQQEQDFSWK